MDKESRLLTHTEQMAVIWELGAGLDNAEGRPPTQKERFQALITNQDAKSVKAIIDGLEKTLKQNPHKYALFGSEVWEFVEALKRSIDEK